MPLWTEPGAAGGLGYLVDRPLRAQLPLLEQRVDDRHVTFDFGGNALKHAKRSGRTPDRPMASRT